MTTPRCNHCGLTHPELEALVHLATEEIKRLCVPCLRSMSHAKAARSDEHGRDRLVKAAERDNREVWRSDHVLYLLPLMAEVREPSQAQDEHPTPVAER